MNSICNGRGVCGCGGQACEDAERWYRFRRVWIEIALHHYWATNMLTGLRHPTEAVVHDDNEEECR